MIKKWYQQHTIELSRGTGLGNRRTNEQNQKRFSVLRDNTFETAVSAVNMANFPASSRTAQRRISHIF